MDLCNAVHPDHPELACALERTERGHPLHLALRPVVGRSQPDEYVWPDPNYRSQHEIREQGRTAKATIDTAAAAVRQEIRRNRQQVPLGLQPGQRKKTRLGQVANVLVNNVGVWIDGHRLETVEVGGSSGLRRLRELRDDYGWNIEQRPTNTSTDQYRLVELPDEFKD